MVDRTLPVARDHTWVTDRTIHTNVFLLSYGAIRISLVLLVLHSFTRGMALGWVLVQEVLALPAWRVWVIIAVVPGVPGAVVSRLAW